MMSDDVVRDQGCWFGGLTFTSFPGLEGMHPRLLLMLLMLLMLTTIIGLSK
jgi:hypothetical protein